LTLATDAPGETRAHADLPHASSILLRSVKLSKEHDPLALSGRRHVGEQPGPRHDLDSPLEQVFEPVLQRRQIGDPEQATRAHLDEQVDS